MLDDVIAIAIKDEIVMCPRGRQKSTNICKVTGSVPVLGQHLNIQKTKGNLLGQLLNIERGRSSGKNIPES
ncbi:hypothetical protein EVAR_9632_1 [Eumeta japonica]|uniref:Uncharacterized protein n=1 Tax=Eumeta variegata TaxID=151549 RepID=A0A4C1TMR8_EUMVA|nr:hypothetical protein EVAR_9632_1 [Eumeta japonica]